MKLALCPAHMPLPARKKKVEQTYYQFVVRTKEIVDLLRHNTFCISICESLAIKCLQKRMKPDLVPRLFFPVCPPPTPHTHIHIHRVFTHKGMEVMRWYQDHGFIWVGGGKGGKGGKGGICSTFPKSWPPLELANTV